ncbi:MAG: hypothetical protein AB7Q45_11720, partial [Planctomycetaceae bacterium]
ALERVSASLSQRRTRVLDLVGRTCGAVRSRYEDQLMRIYLRGGVAGRMMKRLKSALDSTPSGNELNGLFARQAVYRDAKARKLLGYTPQFDLSTGLELSVAWLRHHGQIDEAGPCEVSDEPGVATREPAAARRGVVMEDALA